MENYAYLIKELDINKKFLQAKKDQTLYKIKYIVEYVKNWLFVKEKILKILILLILCVMQEFT